MIKSTGRRSSNPIPMRRQDLAVTADSIEADFRRLVQVLRRTMKTVEVSDKELVERLSTTKVIAERGLRLSRLLSRMTRANPD